MAGKEKLFAESKDEVGLVLFGTQRTANHLAENGYENITEARPLGAVDLDLIEYVKNEVQAGPVSADVIDALVVAMDLLRTSSQGKKVNTLHLLLLSDLSGTFSDDNLDGVIAGLKEMGVEMNYIGPKFDDDNDDDDDDDDDVTENRPSTSEGRGTRQTQTKEKTPQQRAGEALVKHILNEVQGEHYSFSETLPLLSSFEKRAVKQTAWKANLEIGPDLQVPVCGYLKVKQSTQKSWKSTYIKGQGKVYKPMTIRSQHLNNDEETEVEKDDIVEGHRYGNDIIPISEEDKGNIGYKPPGKLMQVLGFAKQENVKCHHRLGNSVYFFVADPADQHGSVALSAVINAMYETNMVAIVRRTYSARSNPRIACLIPNIKANYESLVYIELPFMEDLRQYTFSSLKGNKKHQPSDAQLDAVNNLITNMDLMKTQSQDGGDKEECLKPKQNCNPYYQRLCQVAAYLQPPRAIAAQCGPSVDKVAQLFKLERVKKQDVATSDSIWKGGHDDQAGPANKRPRLDDGDGSDFSMAGIAKGGITEVGTVDPIGDFLAIISQKDEDKFSQASSQMQSRISQLVRDSFGSQFYSKAMDCLKILRQESIKLVEPRLFNNFLTKFKEELAEYFKMDFWDQLISEGLTLIDSSESSDSKVTVDDAKKFLQAETAPKESSAQQEEEDADDLLDMM